MNSGPAVGARGDPQGPTPQGAMKNQSPCQELDPGDKTKSRLYGAGITHHPNFVPMEKNHHTTARSLLHQIQFSPAAGGGGRRSLIEAPLKLKNLLHIFNY